MPLETKQKKYFKVIFLIILAILVMIPISFVIYLRDFKARAPKECPIFIAVAKNDLTETRRLIKEGENIDARGLNGWTAVILAARENRTDALVLLLEAGANPDIQDNYKWAPLHHSILVKRANNEAVQTLINYGANINIRDSHLRTPLHRAAQFGHYRTVEILLNNGADPNAKDKYGLTPSERGEKHAEIVRLLAKYK